ncbi:hypothetical protein E5676_scaffold205G00920 [Cucumis melo var. makuwa]|uniref:Uncharacterized protein n=1 Tax=Cucumis melo var. makuwa TaxID=1194695 RepID=A0A5D3DL29_CUCMM|nr:hypothetical protein E6C27_scaffold6G00200 [Cucumis melo var. makuwa]TYK24321.1 hypothetical protein E5676_scaffold205G00920 [Cucumis melo var. makuwa]
MLAARGEGLLSWIEDDSFIVDEIVTAIPEAVWALGNVAGDSQVVGILFLAMVH